jgi:hypothetical protein
VITEGRVRIDVSAISDGGIKQLVTFDGADIGFTVVGEDIVYSSDD